MYEFFRKYWWAFAVIGLFVVFIGLTTPGLMSVSSYVVSGEADCKIGGYSPDGYRITQVSQNKVTGEWKCWYDTLVSKSDIIVAEAGKVSSSLAVSISCVKNADYPDGALFKAGKASPYDECKGLGCTWEKGVAVCKTVVGEPVQKWTDFFSDESIKGLPNYLLVLAAVFVLLMFGVAGRK